MSTQQETPRQALMREAALWLAQLDSGSADPAAFEAWRDADPRRAAAVARLVGVTHQLDRVRPLVEPDAVETKRNSTEFSRRNWLIGFGAVAATAAAVTGIALLLKSRAAYAATGVGDRQILALPGGARLDLNTDTKVSWRFDQYGRTVWLESGEIALTLPPGPHPCHLIAGPQQTEIASGKINARITKAGLVLLVENGSCAIRSAGARTTTVFADQVADVQSGNIVVRAAPEPERQFTTGWQNDELILDGQTLSEAVDEFNRYQTSKIIVTDPTLAGIRLGGRFSLHDPNDFLASLRAGFGIDSTKTQAGDVVLSRTS